jgi:hypothetical protein
MKSKIYLTFALAYKNFFSASQRFQTCGAFLCPAIKILLFRNKSAKIIFEYP